MERREQVYVHGYDPDAADGDLGEAAGAFGRGLLAGLIGTAVMTAGQMLALKLQGKESSTEPAKAVEKVLGLRPEDQAAEERLAQIVHWGYGTLWGGVRGLLGATGLGGVGGTLAHFLAVWGSEVVGLPALGMSPPITEWPREQVAMDVLHHAVYAAATGAAYEWLES